jgi:hypothetical protein
MPVLPWHRLFGRQACCCYTNSAMNDEMVRHLGDAPSVPTWQIGVLLLHQ